MMRPSLLQNTLPSAHGRRCFALRLARSVRSVRFVHFAHFVLLTPHSSRSASLPANHAETTENADVDADAAIACACWRQRDCDSARHKQRRAPDWTAHPDSRRANRTVGMNPVQSITF
ncbi:hypothetical protein GQ42DRAFT_78564 [Ramicandelaber brevisporus]|nr:hypothetical protein GQ42DRAFT_78564 [Ramicandelaber brevisporus]